MPVPPEGRANANRSFTRCGMVAATTTGLEAIGPGPSAVPDITGELTHVRKGAVRLILQLLRGSTSQIVRGGWRHVDSSIAH